MVTFLGDKKSVRTDFFVNLDIVILLSMIYNVSSKAVI